MLQNNGQLWFGGWPGFTEARIIYDDRRLRRFTLHALDNSKLTIKSLEIVSRLGIEFPEVWHNDAKYLVWEYYIALSQFRRLSHLKVPYWMTPLDTSGPESAKYGSFSDFPLKPLTKS